jgi:hypothetical protein
MTPKLGAELLGEKGSIPWPGIHCFSTSNLHMIIPSPAHYDGSVERQTLGLRVFHKLIIVNTLAQPQ